MIAPAQLIRAPLEFLAGRPGLFVVLAFLLAIQNTYASTLAASLFLARIGASGIPFYYVMFAVVSIPVAALFSSVIDRFPRPFLFRNALGVFILITAALAFLTTLGPLWSYVGYLAVRVFEHLIFSVFYILFADYFTVTKAKRYAGRVALGVALGGLVGGGLLTLTTGVGGPVIASVLVPLLVVLPLGFGSWVTARHHPLDSGPPATREGLLDGLKIVPRLIRRYPLVALMSGAMFLNILLQCMAEFLAFSIYTEHFPNIDDLTVFLGLLNAGLNVMGFLIIVLFTDRQLPRLGVPKMNRVYPALDVLSFGLVAAVPSLPSAVLANMTYDAFEHGIDVPVTTLNYNGIRFRFVGRIRVFIDGMIFPLGLAAAGLLLMAVQGRFDLRIIAVGGLALSVVLFVLHWNIGKHYVRGLIEMLREGAVELDQVDTGFRLPPDRVDEIRAMLTGDARSALMGLQMATRSDGELPAAEIGVALAAIATAQAREIVSAFLESGKPEHRTLLDALAVTAPPLIRQLVWERLLSLDEPGRAEQARQLLGDPDQGVRCVAAARLLVDDPTNTAAQNALRGELSPEATLGAIEVLRRADAPELVPTLGMFATDPDPKARAAALNAACRCAGTDPESCIRVLDWAQRAVGDPEITVRQAGFSALAGSAPETDLRDVAARGLGDTSPEVRQAVAKALGVRGEAAVPAIAAQLRHDREDTQLAAMDALGAAKGGAAEDLLFAELNERVFPSIVFNRRLMHTFPSDHPGWPAMRAALDNGNRRSLRLVMHALDVLGHRRTLDLVRMMMVSHDERSRANAIESLETLPNRRFVLPLLPLIEGHEAANQQQRHGRIDPAVLLTEAMASPDPWLRAAAAVAWHAEVGTAPDAVLQDPSPIVAETVRLLAAHPGGICPYPREALMSRLAFLHNVPLFAGIGLDDLIAVDHALASQTYLAGEAIVTEGEAGDRLCLIYRGEVVVRKGGRVLARLSAGDFFGEMALFDNAPRSATVAAAGEVEVLDLERQRFHSLVQQRPSILIELCTTLVRRLRQAEQRDEGVTAPPLQAAG